MMLFSTLYANTIITYRFFISTIQDIYILLIILQSFGSYIVSGFKKFNIVRISDIRLKTVFLNKKDDIKLNEYVRFHDLFSYGL